MDEYWLLYTNARALTGDSYVSSTNMTSESCLAFCAGFTYAGVEYSEEVHLLPASLLPPERYAVVTVSLPNFAGNPFLLPYRIYTSAVTLR